MEKEMEKRNFLNWYCWYATKDEIEKAKRINADVLERLIKEYSNEIEKINRSRRLFENVSRYSSQYKCIINEIYPVSSV